MVIYDLECEISFGRAIEEPRRQGFNEAAGAHRPGWHGPLPVVSWKGEAEAVLFLVLKGPGPGEAGAADTVCNDAERQIRGWAEEAGIAEPSSGSVIVSCQAIPRQ